MVCDSVFNAVLYWLTYASSEPNFQQLAFECMTQLYVSKFDRNSLLTPLMLKAAPNATKYILKADSNFN